MPHVDLNLAVTIGTGILLGHLAVMLVQSLFRLMSGK